MQITCTSLRKPFGHSGRIGRSIIACGQVARSVARPSRLKKPPGIFPAAYGALLDVDREREEVRAFARLRPARRPSRAPSCRPSASTISAVRLLGELACLEGDLLSADLDGN